MKHIPLMLALALTINLSSFDENTLVHTQNTRINEATSISMDLLETTTSQPRLKDEVPHEN